MSKLIYIILWLLLGWFLIITAYNLIIHNNLDWQALLTAIVCGGLILLDKMLNKGGEN